MNVNRTVLFIPFGVGLAHVGRLMVIASEMKARGYNVVFGAGEEVVDLLKSEGFVVHKLPELPRTHLAKATQLSSAYFTRQKIASFVEAELALYKKISPDLVVSDLRPSAKLSTKIAKIPYVTVNNANLTKYYDFKIARFPFPTFFLTVFLPEKVLIVIEKEKIHQRVLATVGPRIIEIALLKELMKFNLILHKYSQRPARSLFSILRGDVSLITDAPFFRPVKELPSDIKVVGPISWQPTMKLPDFTKNIIAKQKKGEKIIYVTASGTGDKEIFTKILNYLEDLPYTIVATTGNAVSLPKNKKFKENIFVTPFIPGDWIHSVADISISFGGNSTIYQAMKHGVPQIVLPLHIDQHDNANQLHRLNTAIMLNPFKLKQETLTKAIEKILSEEDIQKSCDKYSKKLLRLNGAQKSADILEKLLKKPTKIKPESRLKRYLPQ
jgi:UDP:flavonoid glycosyltransferase YjiC (YdhE family)